MSKVVPALVLLAFLSTPLLTLARSAEIADADFTDGWYRSIRMDTWMWAGLSRDILEEVLFRIRDAKGERRFSDRYDTILEYGPGHWVFEFSASAAQRLKVAAEAQAGGDSSAAFRATMDAALLYTLASYPHLPDRRAREALRLAYRSYAQAGALLSRPFEVWTLESRGVTFPVFVHLPAVQPGQAVPVVLKTGGMDVLSTEFYTLAEQLSREGVAMVAFDMPGNGNDAPVDSETDRHHQRVLDRVKADPRFDSRSVFVWSESLGGHPAVRIAKTRADDLAGVINSCGLLHSVHALALPGVPQDVDFRALVKAYNAGQLPEEEILGMRRLFESSPEMQAQTRNFQYEVYTSRVGADPRNLLDVAAKGDPISLVHQGILAAGVVTSVPILSINTQDDPIVPATDTLLAVQASHEGTMVLFEDGIGHCTARSNEVPVAMEWITRKLEKRR